MAIRIRFCPKCKSTKVIRDLNVLLVFGAPQKWKCTQCGFSNYIFPEIEEEEVKK